MAPRRALARRARRLIGYWRSETRTLRQGLVALVLSTAAGFVAGLTLAHLTGTLNELPGLLAADARGDGHARNDLRRDRRAARHRRRRRPPDHRSAPRRRASPQRRTSRSSRTFSSSLWLAVLARSAAAIAGQPSISLRDLLTISVVGGVLGSG